MPFGDLARLLNEQSERYSKHLRKDRRGEKHRRTRKSLILTLLEYYLQLIQFAVDASGHAASYLRRQTQISDTWNAVKQNRWLPGPSDPLVQHSTDPDLESEYAESVYPPQDQSEEESEEEEASQWRLPEPNHPPPRRPREPDHPPPSFSSSSRVVPRASSVVSPEVRAVPVTQAKAASSGSAPSRIVPPPPPPPRISSAATSKSKAVAKPKSSKSTETSIEPPEIELVSVKAAATIRSSRVDRALTLRPEVELEQLQRRKCSVFDTDRNLAFPQRLLNWGVSVISIDFHQVLDIHRVSKNREIRPTWRDNGIPQENRRAVQRLKDTGFKVIITSYVHTEWRKRQVLNQSLTLPVDKIVICQEDAVGFGGKLDCLRLLFDPDSRSSLLHVDDKAQVCREFHRARADHFASCHVKVPYKPGVEQNIPSVWNLTQAVDRICSLAYTG